MNGFGTIDKKDINVLISSIENRINFIRNDINQNVASLKNQLNACTEELNRLKKLVIQVTNYNDSEYQKLENRINQFDSDIEDIKSKLNTIQYNEIAAGKCASGINEYPIYAKYAENDTNGNNICNTYATKNELSSTSATLSADYTRKIAESSSGGMSALSSVSAQLVDSIEKETNIRQSKDEGLKSDIDNESTERIAKDNELNDKIESEVNNREKAISGLQNLLKNEIARATDVEQGISESLSKEIKDRTNAITEMEGKIASEETRAIKVEQSLQTSIVKETKNREQAISQLQETITIEQNRAETAESNLQESLSNETSRATEAENELLTNLNGEIKRATGIETGLRTDLEKEITRAKESETTIKTTLQENIDKEVTRAKGVENALQRNIDSEATLRESTDNTIQTNLSNEITRATGVETTLTNNLKSEISRALSAELQLDTKIDTNTNEIYDTISSISGHLSSSIISEYNDRVAADISLQNQIDTIEATQNVIDLVANYAALTAYDTTNVKVNDKIQVICDETSANQTTIYSWNNNTWNGIGMFGPYYTKSQVEEEITKAINTEKTERESDIEELNTNKQNNLTAGAGIDLTNDTISVDTDIIATKELVENVSSTIQSKLDNKKDLQEVKSYSGSQTKTITNISQDKNGVITVNYADIDLPQEVPNVEITSEDKSIQVTETTDVQTNTKKFDLSVRIEAAPTFGRFVANNGLTLTKTEGNMTLSSDGKIELKKGKGYHFTIRGNYYNDTIYNDLRNISFIEYSRNETIPIIVDGTLSTSQAQPFEISFDVAQRTSDLNYGIAFSGLTSNGHISGLCVEVHDINSVSVNGGSSGSGDNDKVAVDANAEPGYLENVLVSDSDIVSLVKLGNVLHVQANTNIIATKEDLNNINSNITDLRNDITNVGVWEDISSKFTPTSEITIINNFEVRINRAIGILYFNIDTNGKFYRTSSQVLQQLFKKNSSDISTLKFSSTYGLFRRNGINKKEVPYQVIGMDDGIYGWLPDPGDKADYILVSGILPFNE